MALFNPPKVLREKLGEEGVDALVELVNVANDKQKEDVLVFVEEKFERRLTEVKSALEIKIAEVKSDLEAKIAGVKSDLETKIAEVKSDLEIKITQAKSEMIKWMFIFWAGQTAVLAGLFIALRT
ncbi:MAG: hypothetical protein AB1742_11620 [bacterium]